VFALGEQNFVIVLIHDRMANVCPYQIDYFSKKAQVSDKNDCLAKKLCLP
jgi:hypothetical protein